MHWFDDDVLSRVLWTQFGAVKLSVNLIMIRQDNESECFKKNLGAGIGWEWEKKNCPEEWSSSGRFQQWDDTSLETILKERKIMAISA